MIAPVGMPVAMDAIAPPGGFPRAVKRSVTIAGHETSLALEPVFWTALEDAARARSLPLNALVAAIDVARIMEPRSVTLASALRCWLFHAAIAKSDNQSQ